MVSVAMIQQVDAKAADGGLASVFKVAKVNPLLVQEFTNDEVTDINEFASYFTIGNYEAEASDFIKDRQAALATKPVEAARLRTAILLARGVIARPEDKPPASEQAIVDMEGPLEPEEKESMAKAWTQRYGTTLTMWLDPADPLVNRLWREFRRNTPTLIPVGRVKSVYTDNNPHPEKKVALSGGLVLTVEGKDEGEQVRNVAQYYFSLRVLANASAKAGNFETESKAEKDGKVIFAPLDVNLDYADHAFRMALRQGASGYALLKWLEERDLHTRGLMCNYMRGGYPQGEALTKAMKETEIKWVSSNESQRGDHGPRQRSRTPRRNPRAPTQPKPKRKPIGKTQLNSRDQRPRYASYVKGGQEVCKAYNMGQCTSNPCPHGGAHVCNVITNGKTCQQKHPAVRHQAGR
jgi:hypothetical protein